MPPDKQPEPQVEVKVVEQKAPETRQVIVAQGRTVQHGVRHHGPGALIDMPLEDAAHLFAHGFVAYPETPPAAPAAPQPNLRGPMVNGRPGGVIQPG